MADLTYTPNQSGTNRAKAKLELALDPATTPLSYALVPTANQMDGYRPNAQIDRQELFADETGKSQTAINVRNQPGTQGFQVIASPKNTTVQKMILTGMGKGSAGNDVMARYTDANAMSFQGQAILVYLGEQGTDSTGLTIYGFSVEWVRVGDPTFPSAT
ncbi:hypothetical protein [Deinococcus apachensis]|uniref:hypothetical protein n=1 Tax=Deinococcus apachensis TaxID=309886 RepID=UPI0003639AD6|nr:hypothetical protein [Deinococcus apachensis]